MLGFLLGRSFRDADQAWLGLIPKDPGCSLSALQMSHPQGSVGRAIFLGSGLCLHPPTWPPQVGVYHFLHPPLFCPPPHHYTTGFIHGDYSSPQMGGEEKMVLNELIVRRFHWLLLFQTHSPRTD